MLHRKTSIFAFLLFVLFGSISTKNLKVLLPDYDVESARNVLQRLPSWISEEFPEIRILSSEENKNQLPENGEARIEFDEDGGKRVFARTPTDALYAINSFLRTDCHTQITWSNSSFSTTGCKLRRSFEPITFRSKKLRYFGNICTYSYSFVWWQWNDWEKFIDFLALNGFNTVLMPLGQEAIWRNVFMDFGVPRDNLNRYFTSQAYLAWNRMGNLKGYGGGLSDDQMLNDLNLGKRILTRFKELGIVPVLPTFSGFVPNDMQEIFPSSKFNRLPCWNNFTSEYSCLLSVSPSDPLFSKIAGKFLREQNNFFGSSSNLYSADPFNEITPKSSPKFDVNFLKHTAQAISGSCRKFDKNCVWVLQSWSFSYDQWPNWAVKSFLSAIPIGQLIVLDLYAEIEPSWTSTYSFYGHYFVWCTLHNFGGTRELRGNLNQMNKGYQMALMNSQENLAGGGLTMEAIDQNFVVYQFMIDRMWQNELISLNLWLRNFAESRYSTDNKSAHKLWMILSQTYYNEPTSPDKKRFSVFLYHRPGFGKRIEYWFPVEKTFETLKKLLPHLNKFLSSNPLFVEDANDIMRSIIQFEVGNQAILSISEAFWLEDKPQIGEECEKLMEMFRKIEMISNRDLGEWTNSARQLAVTSDDASRFTNTSVDLLTTWGENGENIDYAHREWSGLISNYYAKRWEYFCEWILTNDNFNRTDFEQNILKYVEKAAI